MTLQLLAFAVGLAALLAGGELLVRGAARLARSLGVLPVVVGLTVVAFGTSAPELVVSVLAAAEGSTDVALGNVVGSNIMNVCLILGLAAVFRPLPTQRGLVTREAPLMAASALAVPLLALDGGVGRGNAALLLGVFALYLAWRIRTARRTPDRLENEIVAAPVSLDLAAEDRTLWRNALLVVAGLVALVGGAELLVGAAVFFARSAGISELAIGVTVVAVGTSLPELVSTTVAARRGEAELAVGGVVGSNIFNTLLILGAAAMIQPVPVRPSLFVLELPAMVLASAVTLLFVATGLQLERWEGALLVGGYAVFTLLLLGRGA